VMVDTWVKAGESKFVYATNEIDALGKSDVFNKDNPTHPTYASPYFYMQNGANIIIKAANTSYITAQIGNNINNIVQVDKGAGLYIVPK